MAEIQPDVMHGDDEITLTWSTVTDADTCGAFHLPPGLQYGSIAVTGTFNTGVVTLQGSPDDVTFFALKDVAATAISISAAGGASVEAPVAYIKPVVTGGLSGQDLDIVLNLRA